MTMNNTPIKNLNYILILLLVLLVVTIGGVIYLLKEVKAIKRNISVVEETIIPEITGPPKITSISLARLKDGEFIIAEEFKKGDDIGVKGMVENISVGPDKSVVIGYQVLNKKGEKINELSDWFKIIKSSSTSNITSCCLGLLYDLSPGDYIVRIILDGETVKDLPFKLVE